MAGRSEGSINQDYGKRQVARLTCILGVLTQKLATKLTVDGDYSHEIERRLLLGRKAMTNLDSILTSRYITLLTKVHVVNLWSFHFCFHSR